MESQKELNIAESSNKVSDNPEKTNQLEPASNSWTDKYRFPFGAIVLIFFQLCSGMGSYGLILSMPVYMSSILMFSDTKSTTIYHAKSSVGYFLHVVGAIVADSWLGRAKTYLILMPIEILAVFGIAMMSIYTLADGILTLYFVLAIIGGLLGPALRAAIPDQIPSERPKMLSTYLHLIYFINNFGVILVSFTAPIMHKDVYCFGIECYPLVFFMAVILLMLTYAIFCAGYFGNKFVVVQPTTDLLINIYKCIFYALKKRVKQGRPADGESWLDGAADRFEASLIRDIKVVLGLVVFLFAHPLFFCVFDQIASIWTLQAGYMNGQVSGNFVIKSDQVQTLNPILVVLLIPLFDVTLYPVMDRWHVRMPYRIMCGQIFTVLACVSLFFIQVGIDNSTVSTIPALSVEYRVFSLQNNATLTCGKSSVHVSLRQSKTLLCDANEELQIFGGSQLQTLSANTYLSGKSVGVIVNNGTIFRKIIVAQTNGGYALVRGFSTVRDSSKEGLNIKLEGTYGLNKDFSIAADRLQYGSYVKCGVGRFRVLLNGSRVQSGADIVELLPAQSVTLVSVYTDHGLEIIPVLEIQLPLLSISWQVVPYVLVTIGEVLFNVNTGVFLYGEAPKSMKSMMLAGQYVCVGAGNVLILGLTQAVKGVGTRYLFLISGALVAVSGVATGLLGWRYLRGQTAVAASIGIAAENGLLSLGVSSSVSEISKF